jgi:hypothetical protein
MARCRAANKGIHIQHDAERRIAIGNDAPIGEGRLKPQELGHKAARVKRPTAVGPTTQLNALNF